MAQHQPLHWQIESLAVQPDVSLVAQAIVANYQLHPVIANILARRLPQLDLGLDDLGGFLQANFNNLTLPDGIYDLSKAADILVDAINQQKKIAIFGDYDVDGISGSALLYLFLNQHQVQPLTYIPQRAEGYGLTVHAVRQFKQQDVQVIVTVDNGIAANSAIALAQQLGMTVVVTDHHAFDPLQLPNAAALVHPGLGEHKHQWQKVSGAGVAFALTIALRQRLRQSGYYANQKEPSLGEAIMLASLGTVADMVPLVGANRIIVREGIARLRKTQHIGLTALIKVAALQQQHLDEVDIGFRLAPRINAAGRVANPMVALNLLIAQQTEQAQKFATLLDQYNRYRQHCEEDILAIIESDLQQHPEKLAQEIIYGAHPEWNHGILGIVAGRLARKYHRPTILFQIQDHLAKGSARSIAGVNLFEALQKFRHYTQTMGGHAEAAGMTIEVQHLNPFIKAVTHELHTTTNILSQKPVLEIDAQLPAAELSFTLIEQLEQLAPFGSGFKQPLFASESLQPLRPRLFKQKHIGFDVQTNKQQYSAIGFRMPDQFSLLQQRVQVAYRPYREINMGNPKIKLMIEALRPSSL